MLGDSAPGSLKREIQHRPPTWGAFTLYLGVSAQVFPPEFPSHHQVIGNPYQALGEGNSIFMSLSEPEDQSRAPYGFRTVTLSTHTRVQEWWKLAHSDPDGYAAWKEDYTNRVFALAEQILPGIKSAARLVLPGTPLTFAFYTRRPQGMVGGFPQTSLLSARGPQTGLSNLWLVGDSIFPGQSTAGVTLGALRVVAEMLRQSPA